MTTSGGKHHAFERFSSRGRWLSTATLARVLRVARRPPQLLAIAESVLLLAAAEASLRVARIGTVARWFGATLDFTDAPPRVDVATLPIPASERLKLSVLARIATHWPLSPQGACLRHSLAAAYLLRRQAPRLRLGVGTGPSTDVTAHAWLEVDGTPVTRPGDYLPLLRHQRVGPSGTGPSPAPTVEAM